MFPRTLRHVLVLAVLSTQYSLLTGSTFAQPARPDSMALVFSTYVGGKWFEQIRDITSDPEGNVYITGGTQSRDFPTTPGAYDSTFAEGGTSLGSGGPMDIFVVKYSPEGRMIWSTLLGGPNYDRAYAIEVDDSGYVYVGGRAGEGFPTTPGVLQPNFGGDGSALGAYGKQDGFVTKIARDGSRLIWSTYFGRNDGGINRDIAIDDSGYVYIAQPGVLGTHPHVTPNAFQPTHGGGSDVVVAKITPDGSRVVWATYYGGSGDDGGGPSVRVDPSGNVTIVGSTTSTDLPVTATAYDTTFNGGTNDLFIAKFSPDGSSLIYGTYLGGSGNEGVETHNLAVDADGNAYVSSGTNSSDFPTTPGAFSRSRPGGNGDTFISKISSDGRSLLGSTFIGGSAGDFSQGIYADRLGNVTIGGTTQSIDFPVTSRAHQATIGGAGDFFIVKLAADFSAPIYATYLGGSLADDGRTLWADEAGNVYAAGQTLSRNWPLRHPHQPLYADTLNRDDGCLARFAPAGNSTGTREADHPEGFRFQVYPNPVSSGAATLHLTLRKAGKVYLFLYDILGRKVASLGEMDVAAGSHTIPVSLKRISFGVYLARLTGGENTSASMVLVVR